MSSGPAAYRFGPLEHRAFLAGLRLSQVVVLAGGSAASLGIVATLRDARAAGPAGLVACLALAGAFVRIGSRAPERWLPLVVRHLWRLLRGSSRFVSDAPLLGHTLRGGPPVAVPDTLRGVSIVSV